jgi:hypothetical protein
MRTSTKRRAAGRRRFDRRYIAAAGALVVFGAIAGVTQISHAATTPTNSVKAIKINGLDVLATTCADSNLAPHTGFQEGNKCVSTEFGEVAAAANDPTLLITEAPRQVGVNQAFSLKVSTRNLIRDRFLGAAAGGYYVESSVLKDGLVRGHFHTACRVLANTNEAPPSDPVPDFFVATEDSKGSATPDVVTINVPGIKKAGTVQCASWAGDGSHRIPMMERANQTPAFDSVRIQVNGGGNAGGQQAGGQPPAGGQQAGGQPPAAGGQQAGGQPPAGGQQAGGQPPAGGQQAGGRPPAGGQQAGGQQAGGQQAGGQQAGGAVAPTKGKPTTQGTIVDNAPLKTESTTTKSTIQNQAQGPAKSTTSKSKSATKSTTSTNSGTSTTSTTKSTGSAAAKSSTSQSDSDYTLDESGQPDTTEGITNAAATVPKGADKNGGLALTGTNSVMIVGVAALLLIIGLTVFSATRRRRSGGVR